MRTNHEGNQSDAITRMIGRALGGSALLLTLVTGAVILHGCGGAKSENSSESSEAAGGSLSAATGSSAYEQTAAVPAAVIEQPRSESEEGGVLPPEIALDEMNLSVVPGQAITVRVQGTPDVTGMLLSDGINDPQSLVRDSSGDDSWRVDYRVPLRPKQERLGLSVTAKNEANRWRRIWVFLEVQKPADLVKAEADSVTQP